LIFGNVRDGMEEPGDLGLVRVADNEGDAGESGDLFGRALCIAAGYEDARGWIGGVNFADGVTGLGIRGSGYRAGVENYDVGS
jgi:hypothetical protein